MDHPITWIGVAALVVSTVGTVVTLWINSTHDRKLTDLQHKADRAEERAIVIHGADYVDAEFARRFGRLGRSHGCPAVRRAVARPLIDVIQGGTVVFAYHDDGSD